MAKCLKFYTVYSLPTSPVLPHYLVKRGSPKFAVNNGYIVSIMGSSETTTSYHMIKRSSEVSR